MTFRVVAYNICVQLRPKASPFDPPNLLNSTLAQKYQFRGYGFVKAPVLPKAGGDVNTGNALLTPNPKRPFSQLDWRSITLASPKAKVDDPPNLLTTTLVLKYLPRAPGSVEIRIPRKAGGDVNTGNALLTPNPKRPFAQFDWRPIVQPASKAKVDDALNLAPFLPAPVVTVQFHQLDWPRPRDPLSIAQPTDQQNLLTSTLAPAPVLNVIYRSPLIARLPDAWPKAKVDDPFDLTIQLPVVVVAPFNQDLWDSATRSYPKVTGEVTGTLSPVLTPNPTRPFSQSDWLRQPSLPKAVGEPLAAISALYNPNPSKPFSQYQWDLATRAWPKAGGEALGEINVLFTPNPAQPFTQFDWPAIRFTQKAKVDDPLNLTPYLPVTTRYLHQDDWPLAALPRAPQKSDVYGAIRPLYSPNPARPFAQSDWPRSTDSIKIKAVGEPIGRVAPVLTPNPAQSFVQSDWFQIRTAQKATVDDVVNLLPLQNPAVVDNTKIFRAPFYARLPDVRPKAKVDDFLNLFPLHAPVVVTKPFHQDDWSKPSKIPNLSDRSFVLGRDINNLLPPLGFGRRKPLLTQAMGVQSGGGGGGTPANYWPDGNG